MAISDLGDHEAHRLLKLVDVRSGTVVSRRSDRAREEAALKPLGAAPAQRIVESPAQTRQTTLSIGGTLAADARTQFDPFQMKYGTSAKPVPLALWNPAPVIALQIARISATAWRMSSQLSFTPMHWVRLAVVFVVVHVRTAPLTICVGMNRVERRQTAESRRPLRPCLALRGRGPWGPVAPCGP